MLDFHFIWQAILIVLIGTILLRISGRKTISEMTLAETVLMISIGTLIIQPVTSKSVGKSFLVGIVLVITLLMLEYAQVKSDKIESLITGKAKIVIENGKVRERELMKLHLTVDQLEMYLRQERILCIESVKLATLEPSGRLSIMLKNEMQAATKGDIQRLQLMLEQLLIKMNIEQPLDKNKRNRNAVSNKNNLFVKIDKQ